MKLPSDPTLWLAVGIWAATGVLLALGDRLLWDLLWVTGGSLSVLHALISLALLAILVVKVGNARTTSSIALVVAFAAVGTALWFQGGRLRTYGDELLFRIRFARGIGAYEHVVATLGKHSETAQPLDAPTFLVDSGPPVRIAFPMPGGILDNWEGIVYDPTGAVEAAHGWNPDHTFSAPPSVQQLFGGDLVACRPIRRSYYRCWFT